MIKATLKLALLSTTFLINPLVSAKHVRTPLVLEQKFEKACNIHITSSPKISEKTIS